MSDDPAAFLGRLVAILDAASVPYTRGGRGKRSEKRISRYGGSGRSG